MSGNELEWLNLLVRWMHLIFGIAWIGSSFYFVWQDNSLEPTSDDPDQERLQGEVWMVHGGGFYHARKYKVAPAETPKHLHWFKWEAYSTWLSGISLLILVYYLGASVYMLPSDSDLTPLQAVGIGITAIAGSWIVYDLMCRSPLGRDDRLLAVAVAILVAVLAYGLCHLLSGRAAFIHVGSAIGTIMVANVFMVIIPNQRRMVNQMLAGETPDPKLGRAGKQRSVHNTYFTLPVLFLMVSNHFAMVTGHDWNWLLLLALTALGGLVRQAFVLRHTGRMKGWMLPVAGAAFVLVIAAAGDIKLDALTGTGSDIAEEEEDEEDYPSYSFAAVQAVIQARCVSCHAVKPTYEGFDAPPKEVVLETKADILRWADAIDKQTVQTDTMPLGNATNMRKNARCCACGCMVLRKKKTKTKRRRNPRAVRFGFDKPPNPRPYPYR
jgi:uncharacterized membrane protein